jgi:Spirocyclase AveC-like
VSTVATERQTVTQGEAVWAERARAGRPSGAIWLWATLGTVGVAYLAWVWIAWLTSGQAHQPAPGPDHYRYIAVLRVTEALSTGVFFFLLWWAIVRPLRAGRGLTLDGKLFIGGAVASSLDIFYSFMNPTWAMNAHAISLGTWSAHIPGFANPGQSESSWGLLWCLPAYIWLGLGASVVGTAMLARLRTRFERLSTVAMYAIVLATFYVAFALIENVWLRTQVYTYVSVPSSLSLWAGKTYQFPVYSPLLIGLYCLSYTWLRDSRDRRDRCAVDRNVDGLRLGCRTKTLLSLLAVTGYAAATTLVAYQIPWDWLSMTAGPKAFPVLPSYLRPGQDCGQPGKPLCASEYLYRLRHHTTPSGAIVR